LDLDISEIFQTGQDYQISITAQHCKTDCW